MTLQVALVGTDGVVLAGDEKILNIADFATGSLSTKIKHTDKLAVSWAWDDIGETIASALVQNPDRLDVESDLEQFIKDTYRSALNNRSERLKLNPRAELLAISRKNLGRALYVEVDTGHCTVRPVQDKIYAGHIKNPGCYFVERYYEKGVLSVAELVPLAAHTVLAAGKLNPLGIEGLEIFTCTNRGIETLPASEVESLSRRAERTDKKIRRLLLEN